jgi:hypothetical protein
MTGNEADRLCIDWLRDNCGREIASKYTPYSMVMPMLNAPDLNQGLTAFRQVLCQTFGPDESFGSTDYHEARAKLGLAEDRVQIPEVFIEAFAKG